MVIAYFICFVLASIIIGAYLTDPFNRFTIIRRTYRLSLYQKTVTAINNNHLLTVRQSLPRKVFAVMKNGVHILTSRWLYSPKSNALSVNEIIDDIYRLRFDPNKLLLTSGDHFSALFVRNLGVFYYPSLDPFIYHDEVRWQHRQIAYTQTLAYALGVFDKTSTLTTTIVPTGRHSATCVNFYAYPSDTLYGMLYALAATIARETARPYNYPAVNKHTLDVQLAGKELLHTYKKSLKNHYEQYRNAVFDETTGLISKHKHLSGAKDITKRTSAFYDNVVFWKTSQLAMQLGLIKTDLSFLTALKQRILSQFWRDDRGHFLEDLSSEAIERAYYSSDWLIVLATGFLSPYNDSEIHYFVRSVTYIHREKIDRPFAIKYQQETRQHRQFLAVRLAVASYGGESIWSFWGMEYIKVLLALYDKTGDQWYLSEADYHIHQYESKIKTYGGFPEVYDASGAMLETPFYRSVRQTGWVIGFDQVRAIRRQFN